MYKLYITLFLNIFILFATAQDISHKINHYLSAKRTFNGTALVVYKSNILLYKGYGYKSAKSRSLNDTGTIFRIGSISKPFTATAILRLEEEGRLKLTDPLSTYIPDYPNGSFITIENLLTHSSGIKDYLAVKAVQELPDSAPPITMENLIGYFKHEPLVIKTGEKFSYSNSNYILLAYIIEKVTGEKFERVMKKMIFNPLYMSHSGFDFIGLADTNKAVGYMNIYKDTTGVVDFDSSYAPGCGSMYTNAMDLYKWYKGLYSGKVINDSTREKAFVPKKWKYGYGFFSYLLYGKKCISHAGGVPGFVSNIQFYPDDDLCIILLSNSNVGKANADRIASIVFGLPFRSSGL